MYKCDIGDAQKKNLNTIYLNEKQKIKVKLVSSRSNDNRIRIRGDFKMYDDRSAILERIDHIEPLL